ncbi:hypothetical protein HKX48_002600 [Thoreauomyces humboldtii]|nr:hypothetical protein HKX48_002600 [Thoreauomyces humboldtii]
MGQFATDMWFNLSQNHDVLLMDQRGVGQSSFLTCGPEVEDALQNLATQPRTEAQLQSTINQCVGIIKNSTGYDVTDFSTTNSARDLYAAIQAVKAGTKPITLYGLSYGTFLVQRFIRMYPAAVQNIVLDGVLSHPTSMLEGVSAATEAFDYLMADCDQSPVCRSALPSTDPSHATTQDVATVHIKNFDNSTSPCAVAFRNASQPSLGGLATKFFERPAVPFGNATIDARVAMLALMFAPQTPQGPPPPPSNQSIVQLMTITASELLLPIDTTLPSFVHQTKNLTIIRPIEPVLIALADPWPKYPSESVWTASPASYTGRALLVNGNLDGQTAAGSARRTYEQLVSAGVRT